MKKLYTFLIALFIISGAMGQGCLPDGITFDSQAQIDDFQTNYPNCTEIEGGVNISGDDITNLQGLNVLTSIGGSLYINFNDALTSLTGLEGLNTINGDLTIGEPKWYSGGNPVLNSLEGLNNLTSIGGDLKISYNDVLTLLIGMGNVSTIGGNLIIDGNPSLASLTGLESLTSVPGSVLIGIIGSGNASLPNLTGLDNVNSIGGHLEIYDNDALASLTGLEGLISINGDLRIGTLAFYFGSCGNPILMSLEGLNNVTSIGGDLQIGYNQSLTSLEGISNIDAASISDLDISGNPLLSNCIVQSVCDYLAAPNGSIHIYGNDTGCDSQEEIEEACESVSIDELDNLQELSIFPNPTQSSFTIELQTQPSKNTSLTLTNTNGQQLITQPITEPKTEIDISQLPAGIYIVKVWNDKDVMVQKVIKQ